MAFIVNTNIENQTNGYLLDAKNVKGGYLVVDSTDDLTSLPEATIVEGSLCYCTADSKFYQYNGTSWPEKEFGTKAEASISAAGLMSATDKTKLNGIAAGAEVNVQSDWNVTDTSSDAFIKNKPNVIVEGDSRLTNARTPVAHNQAATTITEDATHRFVTDIEKDAWNAKSNFSGNYHDLTNKPTIPTNTNQTVKTGSITFGANDVVELVAGSNISISGDATNKKITISSTDTNTETTLTITDKANTDTADLVYAVTNLVEGGTKGHAIETTYKGLPTKTYVDNAIRGFKNITVSQNEPSGGATGDIWFKY